MAPLSTQQLAEFLAAVSSAPDGQCATRIAIERAARSLEAEVAVVIRGGEVAGAIGFPAGRLPVAELAEVVGGVRTMLDVPGAGHCHTVVAPLRGSGSGAVSGRLLLARSGDDGFSVEEVSLVRGMARVLELTVQLLETFEAERRQAEENARLLADLAATDARTQEAMYQAQHDPLTKLASRTLFMQRLAEAGRPAVLFVDLDRFKLVNDSLGHAAGDLLLIDVAGRLRACLSDGETAARLGGDEFAVLLPDIPHERVAADLAGRLLAQLRAPFTLHGKEVFVNASIGIAYGPAADPETLIRDADLAMYEAKRQGKGRFARFEPHLQIAVERKLELEAELRRAIDRDELALHYQPVVRLADGRVTGVEALLRWQHPERGLVLPTEFMALAAESGLTAEIDRWVLSTGCARVSAWNAERADQPPLTLSVNVCARQLNQTDLPATIAEILTATGLRPDNLVVELNGSLLQPDTAATAMRLRQLRATGIRLAMDDFGVGSLSLADLRRLPFDVMKIDRSFVADIAAVPEATALTRALVQLGNSLSLATVAEGIEAANQLAALREAGCQFGQGYYFSKPLDPEELDTLI